MKRIISSLLVVMMLVCFIPSVSAASDAWAEPEGIVYTFDHATHGYESTSNLSVLSAQYARTLDKVVEGKAPWAYVGVNDRASLNTTPSGSILWTAYLDTTTEDVDGVAKVRDFDPDASRGARAIMFEIVIDKPGTYVPGVVVEKNTGSAIMEYHLVKKQATDKGYDGSALSDYVKKLTTATKLGTIDQLIESSKTFAPITVEAGNYYLVGIPVGSNPNCVFPRNKATHATMPNRAYFVNYLSKFSLTKVAEENAAYTLDFSSRAFRTQGIDLRVAGNVADEGYLGYWGTDNGANSANRYKEGGWLGASASSSRAAVIRGVATYGDNARQYLNPEKTGPWNFYPVSKNNTYVDGNGIYMNSTLRQTTSANRPIIAIRTNIPATGKYKFSLNGGKYKTSINDSTVISGADSNIYVFQSATVPESSSSFSSEHLVGTYKFYKDEVIEESTRAEEVIGTLDIDIPGEYYIAIVLHNTAGAKEAVKLYAPEGNTADEIATHYLGLVYGAKFERIGDTDSVSAGVAEKAEDTNIDSGNLTPENININTTATVSAVAAYVGGEEISSEVISVEKTEAGETCTVKAPEKKDGYSFLYWAKAGTKSRVILSDKSEYTFRPVLGAANRLIAVYASEKASAENKGEFYDANGQLLEIVADGGKAPALPSLPGFGTAKAWINCSNSEEVAPGDAISPEGIVMYAALYEETINESVNVTVNGTKTTYAYGEAVKVTAASRKTGESGKVFAYWTKDGEIVSFDKEYEFLAANDCTLEAVYNNYAPGEDTLSKIVFSTLRDGRIHAEFIGLDSAVEKGVIFGGETLLDATTKVTMVTDGNQFTLIDNVDGDGIGYAILASGKVVYGK